MHMQTRTSLSLATKNIHVHIIEQEFYFLILNNPKLISLLTYIFHVFNVLVVIKEIHYFITYLVY